MIRHWIPIKPLALVAALFMAAPANAQRELPLNGKPVIQDYFEWTAVYFGSVDMADYDGDGDEDVLLSGRSGSHMVTKVYCQADLVHKIAVPGNPTALYDTVKTFLETTTNLPSLWQSDASWGDYDRDGDLDVIVSGLNGIDVAPTIGAVTRLYELRGGIFVEDLRSSFPGVYSGENAWGDYDGDGDLDVVLTGATRTQHPYTPLTSLHRNDGGRFTAVESNLPNVAFGAAAWADVDGDGDLDLALQGEMGAGRFLTDVYLNSGKDRFEAMNLRIPALAFGSLDWADFDNDGDPDLLATGGRYDPNTLRGVTELYVNDGGTFTRRETGMAGALFGSGLWTDYDLDGKQDVVLMGAPHTVAQPAFRIYLNSGTSFDEAFATWGMVMSDLTTGDYNLDGDPDVFAIGQTFDKITFTNFFQNEILPDPDLEDLDIVETFGCLTGESERR